MALRLLIVFVLVLGLTAVQAADWPAWPEMATGRWNAIEAIATMVVATATVLGLAAIAAVFQQVTENRARTRAELGPYLRIDLSPVLPSGTWQPPAEADIDNVLMFTDLNPGEEPDLGPLDDWPGNVDIYLWVRNLQHQPAGNADNISVMVDFEVPDVGDHDVAQNMTFELTLAYLQAGQSVRYRIASVSNAMPWLRGRIREIRYRDIFGTDLSFAHGSAEFSVQGADLVNERHVFRGE